MAGDSARRQAKRSPRVCSPYLMIGFNDRIVPTAVAFESTLCRDWRKRSDQKQGADDYPAQVTAKGSRMEKEKFGTVPDISRPRIRSDR